MVGVRRIDFVVASFVNNQRQSSPSADPFFGRRFARCLHIRWLGSVFGIPSLLQYSIHFLSFTPYDLLRNTQLLFDFIGDLSATTAKWVSYTYLIFNNCQLIFFQDCNFILSGADGGFASLNYPNNYDNELNCQWTFIISANIKINLTFNSFDTEGSADVVRVRQNLKEFNGNSVKLVYRIGLWRASVYVSSSTRTQRKKHTSTCNIIQERVARPFHDRWWIYLSRIPSLLSTCIFTYHISFASNSFKYFRLLIVSKASPQWTSTFQFQYCNINLILIKCPILFP